MYQIGLLFTILPSIPQSCKPTAHQSGSVYFLTLLKLCHVICSGQWDDSEHDMHKGPKCPCILWLSLQHSYDSISLQFPPNKKRQAKKKDILQVQEVSRILIFLCSLLRTRPHVSPRQRPLTPNLICARMLSEINGKTAIHHWLGDLHII